jgi:hypothetical protein
MLDQEVRLTRRDHNEAESEQSLFQALCLHERVPSGATRRVQPMQLQNLFSSVYCRVSYSMLGLESEAKLQTLLVCLFMSGSEVFFRSC